MSSKTFALGQRVRISGTVHKQRNMYREITHVEAPAPSRTVQMLERDESSNKTTRWTFEQRLLNEGVIVGKRTLTDGVFDWEDGYAIYTPTRGTARTAWLVSVALDRRPVYCWPDQIEEIPNV